MKKPKNIDQDASWQFEAWFKGKTSKKGMPVGEYTLWDEKGILLNEGYIDKHNKIIWCKIYYPDGTIGCDIVYNKEKNQTSVTYKSYHEHYSRLITPLEIGAKGFAVKIYDGLVAVNNADLYNGSTDGVSFYNEKGEYINTYENINYESLIEKYTQHEATENWRQALERLNNYWSALQKLYTDDGIEIENDYFTVSFDKSVTKEGLEKAEKRLGIQFPHSYKQFVLDQGLIKFGDDQGYSPAIEQKMLHPDDISNIDNALDPEGEGYYNSIYTLSEDNRKQLICFFKDQEDYQYDGWVVFDLTTAKDMECNILHGVGCKNIFEWENKVSIDVFEKQNTIDKFISAYVNILIREREP